MKGMKLFGRILGAVFVNAAGLWLASYLITQFDLIKTPESILTVALVLTVLNFLVRPILKFLLAPLILLTLGLGLIAINAFILFLLDILSKDLSIQGIPALLGATLIVSGVNIIFHFLTRS